MPKNAHPNKAPDPLLIGTAAIAAVTLYRVVLLAFSTADLFVDEAQYWQWGQELDWGYYSKPPLIGWVLRAFTELAGSDSPFWVRLPGALFHAATALILMGAARRITDPVAAMLVGVIYVTLPVVAVGSLLISTDTILLPFFAASVWLYLKLTDGRSAGAAAALGLCLGLGMLAKYAAIYFVICAGLAALVIPAARIAWRDLALAAAVFALVISPNVIWNLQNDLMTLSHTADNVDWVRRPGISLNVPGAVEFLASQFLVMGPVLFAAYLVIAARTLRGADWSRRWLVWMSAPILALVTMQALLSKAYANWAVTAYVAAVLLVVPVLWHRARMVLWAGLAVNLALVVFLPVAATQTTSWTAGASGRLVMRRYAGRVALSEKILEVARAQGVGDIVSGNRQVLADLFHTAKGSGIAIFAEPAKGRPPHFYAQRHAYPAGQSAPFLYVTLTDAPPPCPGPGAVADWTAGPGAYEGNTVRLYLRGPDCWSASRP